MSIKSFLVWGFLLISWMRDARGAIHKVACSTALGMEKGNIDYYIRDSQLSASSQSSKSERPSLARLNNERKGFQAGWCSDVHYRDPKPYLQIDLLTPHTITKLATQGANSNWVKNFSLSFSYDNISWFSYRVNGKIQFFKGNRNPYRTVWNNLTQPLTARAIRFLPVVDDPNNAPCLRVELYGCQPSEDCNTPVGVENRKITNNQMSASSHWNQHYASNARLNNQADSSSGRPVWGGWCTDRLDKNQYLQVDLGRVRSVSGVATQGYMWDMFVSQYRVNYSTDGYTWRSYKERGDSGSKIFQGNWDNDTAIKKVFSHRIFARYIRFNPIAWNPNGYICMRVEIYECLPTKGKDIFLDATS